MGKPSHTHVKHSTTAIIVCASRDAEHAQRLAHACHHAQLNQAEVVRAYASSRRRLVVLGYNATLTTAVEAPRQPKRHFDQIKALTRMNPRVLGSLQAS